MAERSEDRPAPAGCSAFRQGLVLAALEKRLAQAVDPAERARLQAEIEALERDLQL